MRSELSSTLLSKRISNMHKSRDKLVELSGEIVSLKQSVLRAQREGYRYVQLCSLLQEIKTFQSGIQQENIPEEALVSQFDWPVSMICTLTNIVKEIGTFKTDLETCLHQEHTIKVLCIHGIHNVQKEIRIILCRSRIILSPIPA